MGAFGQAAKMATEQQFEAQAEAYVREQLTEDHAISAGVQIEWAESEYLGYRRITEITFRALGGLRVRIPREAWRDLRAVGAPIVAWPEDRRFTPSTTEGVVVAEPPSTRRAIPPPPPPEQVRLESIREVVTRLLTPPDSECERWIVADAILHVVGCEVGPVSAGDVVDAFEAGEVVSRTIDGITSWSLRREVGQGDTVPPTGGAREWRLTLRGEFAFEVREILDEVEALLSPSGGAETSASTAAHHYQAIVDLVSLQARRNMSARGAQ